MSAPAQQLRLLDGCFVLERHADADALDGDWLWIVRAPDGVTVVRSAPAGTADAWVGLHSGDTAHAPDVAGMLVALLAPLADAGIAVMVASTFDADVLLVPESRLDAAAVALRAAGHAVET